MAGSTYVRSALQYPSGALYAQPCVLLRRTADNKIILVRACPEIDAMPYSPDFARGSRIAQ